MDLAAEVEATLTCRSVVAPGDFPKRHDGSVVESQFNVVQLCR
jgi:hypothetical protein